MLILEVLDEELSNYFKIVPVLFSLLFTIFYYGKTIGTINGYPIQLRNALKSTRKILIIFPLIQVVNVLPFLLFLIMTKITGCPRYFKRFAELFLSCAGLTNASIYLFQIRKVLQKLDEDFENSGKAPLL